jgi:hypothetical protein
MDLMSVSPVVTPKTWSGHGELPRLSSAHCRSLLSAVSSGHVALSLGALPLVVPVTCVLDGDRLLVRAGLALMGRVSEQPGIVAFEAAGTSPNETWRWEILIQGRAAILSEVAPAKVPPPLALVDSELTTALCISMELLTGWQYGTPAPEKGS